MTCSKLTFFCWHGSSTVRQFEAEDFRQAARLYAWERRLSFGTTVHVTRSNDTAAYTVGLASDDR
jgi:hypothetical protein